MSWLTSLSETYDNFYGGAYGQTGERIVPVGFTEKNVLFTVRLDADGNFYSASRNEEKTVQMPSSPKAAGRTGSAPFPLYDELRYMAGDLSGMLGIQFEAYFESYITALREWSQAAGAPSALKLLLGYLEQKTLANDLRTAGYITDKDLASRGTREKLYKGMVEFQIYNGKEQDFIGIAEMPEVQQNWLKRLNDSMGDTGLCYASGEMMPIVGIHPKLFGNTKLISSKDVQRIFQYKGRFDSASDACSIGYETSEKAHNTLRWLLHRQGFRQFNLHFVAWSKECYDVMQPDASLEFLGIEPETKNDTAEDYAKFLSARIAGYQKKPAYAPATHVVLIGLEAATPGRMSINYYEEFGGKEYLDRLERWYETCFWRISWVDKENQRHTGVSTPSLAAIGDTVFGRDAMMSAKRDVRDEKSGTKQVKHFYLHMLACISGGRRVPIGYSMTAYHRVLKPQSFRNKSGIWKKNDWIDCMGVALAMLKSADTKEEYNVALNEKETDRSYLYGRLTAVADVIESRALRETDSGRMTNAVRLFTAMQQHPATTWKNLELKLSPYVGKLGVASSAWYMRLIDSIIELGDNLMGDNSPLSPRFIEGYHNQRYVLLNKKKEN